MNEEVENVLSRREEDGLFLSAEVEIERDDGGIKGGVGVIERDVTGSR